MKIGIPENSVREIKDKALSILLPISIGVAIIATFGLIISNFAFMAQPIISTFINVSGGGKIDFLPLVHLTTNDNYA